MQFLETNDCRLDEHNLFLVFYLYCTLSGNIIHIDQQCGLLRILVHFPCVMDNNYLYFAYRNICITPSNFQQWVYKCHHNYQHCILLFNTQFCLEVINHESVDTYKCIINTQLSMYMWTRNSV